MLSSHMKTKRTYFCLGMTLACLTSLIFQSPAMAGDLALGKKIRQTVSRLVKVPHSIENLSCALMSPSGREPAANHKHILSYRQLDDDRNHQIETELSSTKIVQVRSLTIEGRTDRQIILENQVWRSLAPEDKVFRADLEGRDASMNLVTQKAAKTAAAQVVEQLAPLIKACCESVSCAGQLSSTLLTGHKDTVSVHDLLY